MVTRNPNVKTAKSITSKAIQKTVVNKKPNRKGLGTGLNKLLGADIDFSKSLSEEGKGHTDVDSVKLLSLSVLQTGKYQPRSLMSAEELQDLANSIREDGVMQPILVRPLAGVSETQEKQYEIIAGERRFRAAALAGLSEIPVLIRPVSDEKAAVMALIENIQREDLNPLEEAKGVRRLIDEFHFTHEQAAQAIGRSRSLTSNLLRLLNLAKPVQNMLLSNELDMGHARALLALPAADQIIIANQVVAKKLSVRETEKLVNQALNPERNKDKAKVSTKNRDVERIEEALSDYLGTKVCIHVNKKQAGQLTIDFHNWEQLNALLEKQGLSVVLD